MTYLMLIIGFILLIKGADFFVDGSSSVAKLLKVPAIVIGLTVVAFGTSMPEASVSITAALQGKNDLAVSNLIGSNIFNLLVVLGASAFVCPIKANVSVLKKEFPFSIIATIILLVMMIPLSIKELLGGSYREEDEPDSDNVYHQILNREIEILERTKKKIDLSQMDTVVRRLLDADKVISAANRTTYPSVLWF